MQVHQVLVSASAGDAITNEAVEIRDLLRAAVKSDIYALHRDSRLGDEVLALRDFNQRRTVSAGDDILIFHASIGEPDVTRFVSHRPERLVVIYHNISPWEPFLPYAPAFAGLLVAGRAELASLAHKTELAIADSQYNADELVDAGFERVVVSPLIVDIERMWSVEPHAGTMHHLDGYGDDPLVLFVGQLLPHKRPDLLLAAYNVLATHLVPGARLIMVGAPRLPGYHAFLEHYVRESGLRGAWITGAIGEPELMAFYRHANTFVTMSEHEGFCVPLLEAMGFGIPIIARRFAAVPETLGDAGVLLDPDDGALVAAEAMAATIEDQDLRSALAAKGKERILDFSADVAKEQMLGHLLAVL